MRNCEDINPQRYQGATILKILSTIF